MHYQNVRAAKFIDRPNRFIAHVELDGSVETVHVKNTGRCRELLVPGCTEGSCRTAPPSARSMLTAGPGWTFASRRRDGFIWWR